MESCTGAAGRKERAAVTKNPADGIKDAMWRFLMDGGQKENIPGLKASVYRLIGMTTQKTAGQRPDRTPTHISWETLDMEIMRIVIEATALVLSGRLDELEDKQMDTNGGISEGGAAGWEG